jgi:hypothetical protein
MLPDPQAALVIMMASGPVGGAAATPYLKMFPAREQPAASPNETMLGTTFSTQATISALQSHASTTTCLESACCSLSNSRCSSGLLDDGEGVDCCEPGAAHSLALQSQAEIFVGPLSFQSHFLHAGLRELHVGHLRSPPGTSLGGWLQTLRLLADAGCRSIRIQRFTIPDSGGGGGSEGLSGSLEMHGGGGRAAQLQLDHLPASPAIIADARCGRLAGLTGLAAGRTTATAQLLRALAAVSSLQRLELQGLSYRADACPAGGGGHSSQPLPVLELPRSGSGQALTVWRPDPLACLAALAELRVLRIRASPASPGGLVLSDSTLEAWKGGLLQLTLLEYQGPICDSGCCRHTLSFKGMQELRSIKLLDHLKEQPQGAGQAPGCGARQAIPLDFLSLPLQLRSLTLSSVRLGALELQLLAAGATRLQQLSLVLVQGLAQLLPAIAGLLPQLSHLALVDADVLEQPGLPGQPPQQQLASLLQPLLHMPHLASLTFASRAASFTAADMAAARREQRQQRAGGPQLQVLVLLVPRPGGWELLSGRCLCDARGGSPLLEQDCVSGMLQRLLEYQPEA